MQSARWIVVVFLLHAAGAPGLTAQVVDPPDEEVLTVTLGPDEPVVDSLEAGGVSPMGAFLRAVAIPGWGHAAVGAHGRGGFYVTAQAVNGYMMIRTRSRLNAAQELRGAREARVRAELAADGVTDEILIQSALDADEGWARADRLTSARQQQFEDWMALGIFTLLLSGADALISAHLQDFPDVAIGAVGDEGRVELRVSVPLGGWY